MNTKRALTIAAILVAFTTVAAVGVFQNTRPVRAQDQVPPPVNDRISFGTVGITSGQTLRVTVANTQQPDNALPVDPCKVAITFRYANGQSVRGPGGEEIRKVEMVDAGKTAIFDISFDKDLPPLRTDRVQIRAIVTVIPPPVPDSNALPVDPCVPTVEVLNNNNGRTQFVVSALPAVQRILPAVQ